MFFSFVLLGSVTHFNMSLFCYLGNWTVVLGGLCLSRFPRGKNQQEIEGLASGLYGSWQVP